MCKENLKIRAGPHVGWPVRLEGSKHSGIGLKLHIWLKDSAETIVISVLARPHYLYYS